MRLLFRGHHEGRKQASGEGVSFARSRDSIANSRCIVTAVRYRRVESPCRVGMMCTTDPTLTAYSRWSAVLRHRYTLPKLPRARYVSTMYWLKKVMPSTSTCCNVAVCLDRRKFQVQHSTGWILARDEDQNAEAQTASVESRLEMP